MFADAVVNIELLNSQVIGSESVNVVVQYSVLVHPVEVMLESLQINIVIFALFHCSGSDQSTVNVMFSLNVIGSLEFEPWCVIDWIVGA